MKRYWIAFAAVLTLSFAVLGWAGSRVYQQAPPIPLRVVTTDGAVVVPEGGISAGQNVWQALGGMEIGSVWGHGSYVAPDWSADYLHREATFIREEWARSAGKPRYADLAAHEQASMRARLTELMRTNTYDPSTGELRVDPVRARAFEHNLAYISETFRDGREDYAIPEGALTDPQKLRALTSFFFWSAWSASTNRPGEKISYTSNWPHEPLVGNVPTPDTIVWTGVSIVLLLAAIGAMASWHASRNREESEPAPPRRDPLLEAASTPSQRAVVKYFFTVSALLLVQIAVGVIAAHYGVEGAGFYGVPLAKVLPYVVARTWHVQLGIFWIATAWLGAGLYIAPAIGGGDPRWQRLGVNVLFGALLVVVVGSLTGQLLSVRGALEGAAWFYLGHSGYEYIDLGRFWQIALLVGLGLWFVLMTRALWPALLRRDGQRSLLALLLISCAAIAGFYGAALGYGRTTNLAIAEYFRWWVVHLWVEGFFEVFATVVIAFLFARMRLVQPAAAARASVLSATVFLAGGVVGTLHHLYFSGTPTSVIALGSVFSALEVVPLMFVGYEAWENIRRAKVGHWTANYRWPISFFVAVAFWNLLGAGVFGFMINPPIALYYMQGLNTTPVHGHAALFGVYGMLGLGLVLFCLRAVRPGAPWKDGLIRFAFWAINVGLLSMVVLSLLPVGLLQTSASIEHGYWYARSAEFLQSPLIVRLRWLRVIGDTLFAIGAVAYVVFVIRLRTGGSYRSGTPEMLGELPIDRDELVAARPD